MRWCGCGGVLISVDDACVAKVLILNTGFSLDPHSLPELAGCQTLDTGIHQNALSPKFATAQHATNRAVACSEYRIARECLGKIS